MGFNLAKWFIEGEVDWEFWNKALAAWGPAVAGALFGAGAHYNCLLMQGGRMHACVAHGPGSLPAGGTSRCLPSLASKQHRALLPAGWWCWADAYVYQHAVVGAAYPFKYNLPGIGATDQGAG